MSTPGSRAAAYVLAVLATIAALALTRLLGDVLEHARFTLFYAAVALSAWRGGLGPGLLAAGLAVLAVDYFLVPPIGTFRLAEPGEYVALAVFAGVAALISSTTASLRAAHAGAERAAGDLRQATERTQQQATELEMQMAEAQSLGEELEQTNADLHASLAAAEETRRRVSAQLAVSRVVAAAHDFERALPPLLETLGREFGAAVAECWLPEGEASPPALRCRARWHASDFHGPDFERITSETTFAPGEGLPGRAWAAGEPVLVGDVTRDEAFPRRDAAAAAGLRAALAFPIRNASETFGVVELFWPTTREPDRSLRDAVSGAGHQIGQLVERTRAEAAVRAGEVRNRAVLEASLDCVIGMDHRGRITEWNPAAENTFGHPRAEALGRELGDLIVPRRLRAAHRAGLARYLRTGEEHVLGRRLEMPACRADGTEFPSELAIVRNPLPGPPSFTGFLRDVTEAKHAEAERARLLAEAEAARAEAEEANQAKSQFLATMSHELRTPLNAIGGYADLMAMGIRGPITDQQREDLERIKRSQRHLLSLVNDVLNFAKLEAGQLVFDIRDVQVQEVLDELEPLVAPQLHAKRLRYACPPCGDAALIARADAEKVRQILLNLLSNAIKFTPDGGEITVRAQVGGDHVCVEVADTGVGIPPDRLEHIFEPFVQVDRHLPVGTEGTGLGLAISRDLARGMGGELAVKSEVGKGSTFTLALPRR